MGAAILDALASMLRRTNSESYNVPFGTPSNEPCTLLEIMQAVPSDDTIERYKNNGKTYLDWKKHSVILIHAVYSMFVYVKNFHYCCTCMLPAHCFGVSLFDASTHHLMFFFLLFFSCLWFCCDGPVVCLLRRQL
jgi:hypothetical protein